RTGGVVRTGPGHKCDGDGTAIGSTGHPHREQTAGHCRAGTDGQYEPAGQSHPEHQPHPADQQPVESTCRLILPMPASGLWMMRRLSVPTSLETCIRSLMASVFEGAKVTWAAEAVH